MKRKTVEVVVFNNNDLSYELPEDPNEFMSWWQEKFDMIPENYRETARVRVEISSYYDCAVLKATVSYTRLESDNEVGARKLKEKQQREFRV